MELNRKTAIIRLWNMGILHWKLDKVQKDLYDHFQDLKAKTVVWSCSRRLGKSYALCVIAIEKCLQKPNTVVKFIAPTQKHVKLIIRPLLRQIFQDCPSEIKPDFRTADNIYRFGNMSEIQLAGTDSGHAESIRGGNADICIVDEAGFCDDLEYIVQSILVPTTTTTRGKIILSSTPPKKYDHEFRDYMEKAESQGNFLKKTIYDGLGGRITQQMIDEIIEEYGGVQSIEFRREFLCEVIKDEEISVIPEFDDGAIKDLVKTWIKPDRYDAYVSGDIGGRDFTVFLFGYWDFRAAKLIIEDEVVMRGSNVTTDNMAKGINEAELRLWHGKPPYMRVCDNDLIVINNLREQNKLLFLKTEKTEKRSVINNLRILVKEKRLIIHPKCNTLIQHLKYATWNKKGDKFNRSGEHGHYDALDSCLYMLRNVQQFKNPYPSNYGHGSGDTWWEGIGNKPNLTPVQEKIKDWFTPKPSLSLFKKKI